MSKFCKKCGKEIPQSSKRYTCENCQNKKWGVFRKVGGAALGLAACFGFALWKDKFGKPKA